LLRHSPDNLPDKELSCSQCGSIVSVGRFTVKKKNRRKKNRSCFNCETAVQQRLSLLFRTDTLVKPESTHAPRSAARKSCRHSPWRTRGCACSLRSFGPCDSDFGRYPARRPPRFVRLSAPEFQGNR